MSESTSYSYCLSLNFETAPGFSTAIKYKTKNRCKIVSIQHGFVEGADSLRKKEAIDYYSDYYVFWSYKYLELARNRFGSKCKFLVDGGRAHIDNKSKSKVEWDKGKVIYLSSFSLYSPKETIEEELECIKQLHEAICPDILLIVRLHPSILKGSIDESLFPSELLLQYSFGTPLSEALLEVDVTFTRNSTACIESLSMGIPIVILPYHVKNILSESFGTTDVKELFSLDLNDLKLLAQLPKNANSLLYGEVTGQLKNLVGIT